MVIQLTPQLQASLAEEAGRRGVTPEELAIKALQERFPPKVAAVVPQDEWERRLAAIAKDFGVAPPLEAMTSEGLYD